MIKTEKAIGIITAFPGNRVRLTRFYPAEQLAPFVEHFWMVSWELEGQPPFVTETLPHPSVHLVFEKGKSRLVGVQEGKFTRTLEGNGHVFSAKFKPGGFFPFTGSPVSALTNRTVPPAELFGEAIAGVEDAIVAGNNEEKIAQLEKFLLGFHPAAYPELELLQRLCMQIAGDRGITRVEQVAEAAGMSVRRLQRLFSRYVGVSPKWTIRRYRLHDALERLKVNPEQSLAGLAADLGYADQAHFIRDFKKIIGITPGSFGNNR
jgi:AraC-like DNA-binding protein